MFNKKINMKINSILGKSGLNKFELSELLNYLGIDGVQIDWKANYSTKPKYMILNIGGKQRNGRTMPGTHFVAVDNKNKRYFDPIGFPPVQGVPANYEYVTLQVQDESYGHCGAYCALFLLYSKENELDKFYNMFQIDHKYSALNID